MKFATVIFLFFILTSGFAQQDSITLYTKAGCGNCKYTKEQLQKAHIYYTEYELGSNNNAKLMLKNLHRTGYSGNMYLPIIFINDSLFHPAIFKDSVLVKTSLPIIVDSILTLSQNGTFSFKKIENNTSQDQIQENDDCEIHNTSIYIVCKNFEDESQALDFSQNLINTGFPDAGFFLYNKMYRVYSYITFSQIQAQALLELSRKQLGMSYILEITH